MDRGDYAEQAAGQLAPKAQPEPAFLLSSTQQSDMALCNCGRIWSVAWSTLGCRVDSGQSDSHDLLAFCDGIQEDYYKGMKGNHLPMYNLNL